MKIVIIGLVTALILSGFGATCLKIAVANAGDPDNGMALEFDLKSNALILGKSKEINIDKPLFSSFYLEKDLIVVHVVDQDGNNVEHALVEIIGYGIEDTTGILGNAWLIAPRVGEDTWVTIRAEKRGDFDEISIQIKNKYLKVSAPSSVDEGEKFDVFVRDQDGHAVSGAKVTFDDTTKYTNLHGKTTFTAPFVRGNTGYNIIASAPLRFYEDGKKQITVINNGNEVTICGYVVGDAGDNGWVPAYRAKIIIDGNVMTRTDAAGRYSFVITPRNGGENYKITASHNKYGLDSWSGVIYGTGETIYINFALK